MTRQATMPMAKAIVNEIAATLTRAISIVSPILVSPLAQSEFHRHFDEYGDPRAMSQRRRELPLSHRGDSAFVQPGPEPSYHAHVGDGAVGSHDHLQQNLSFEARPARLLGVIGGYFTQESRRLDAAPRSVRSTTGAASVTGPNAASGPLTDTEAGAAADPASGSGTTAVIDRCRQGHGWVHDPTE
jgi:hypothetical protein